jgi:hypothetical protein
VVPPSDLRRCGRAAWLDFARYTGIPRGSPLDLARVWHASAQSISAAWLSARLDQALRRRLSGPPGEQVRPGRFGVLSVVFGDFDTPRRQRRGVSWPMTWRRSVCRRKGSRGYGCELLMVHVHLAGRLREPHAAVRVKKRMDSTAL